MNTPESLPPFTPEEYKAKRVQYLRLMAQQHRITSEAESIDAECQRRDPYLPNEERAIAAEQRSKDYAVHAADYDKMADGEAVKRCARCCNPMADGTERPISMGNPSVCVPCATGVELSPAPISPFMANPCGRW